MATYRIQASGGDYADFNSLNDNETLFDGDIIEIGPGAIGRPVAFGTTNLPSLVLRWVDDVTFDPERLRFFGALEIDGNGYDAILETDYKTLLDVAGAVSARGVRMVVNNTGGDPFPRTISAGSYSGHSLESCVIIMSGIGSNEVIYGRDATVTRCTIDIATAPRSRPNGATYTHEFIECVHTGLVTSGSTPLVLTDCVDTDDLDLTPGVDFTDWANGDYSLPAGSALIGAGDAANNPAGGDITGADWENPPAIGAYEFVVVDDDGDDSDDSDGDPSLLVRKNINISRRLAIINGYVEIPHINRTLKNKVTIEEALELIPGSSRIRIGPIRGGTEYLVLPDNNYSEYPAEDYFKDLKDEAES